MSNVLKIDAFLPELGDDIPGMSSPELVICDDGHTYLLKNQTVFDPIFGKWVEWNSMFLHEFLVSNIAKYLGISTPDVAIIDVDSNILEHDPTRRFKSRFEPGLHFGSKYLHGVENNILSNYQTLKRMGKKFVKRSWTSFFRGIDNKDDVPKIIALDLLTYNLDRFTNMGNLIINKENNKRKIHAIDHGHCFKGPTWDIRKQAFLKEVQQSKKYCVALVSEFYNVNNNKPLGGLGEIFNAMEQFVDLSDPENHSFMDVVYLIENINADIIDSWFEDIPDKWFAEKDKEDQMSYYKQFLLKQKNNIRLIIIVLIHYGAFNDYTGGDLQWREERTGTQ